MENISKQIWSKWNKYKLNSDRFSNIYGKERCVAVS